MASPIAFPKMITASTWARIVTTCREAAFKQNGGHTGLAVPLLTNADAIALIRAWRAVINNWPMWYQFAAVAYGWDPATDKLDTSAARMADAYAGGDREITGALWIAVSDIAEALDDAKDGTKPRVDIEPDAFANPVVQGAVRSALMGDGAEAAFKIPLPACKKPDGSMGMPVKGKDGKWRCAPVAVDDPITHATSSLGPIILIVGMLWLLSGTEETPRRRRRN